MLKQDKGITLIALIITIIVMMILVAVSVTVALDGGLFGTAKKAASETELKAEEEILLSAVVGAVGRDGKVKRENLNLPEGFTTTSEGVIVSPNGNRFTVSSNGEIAVVGYKTQITGLSVGVTLVPYEELTGELKTAADEGKIVAVLKEIKDGVEYQAVIPAGFDVSTKKGENTISGGLVVSDVNENEFVWVPCTADASNTSGLIKYAKDTKYNDGEKATKQREYTKYSDWKDEDINPESVSKYGGFYVGRYEAGIPSNAPFHMDITSNNYIREGRDTAEYIPVSKPNNPCWNFISQSNAKKVSEKMYSTSISVESGLIDSYAWDTIVNWMESEYPGIATNSANYGEYVNSTITLTDGIYAPHIFNCTTSAWDTYASEYRKETIKIPARTWSGIQTFYEIATGSSEDTKVLNIYDMAGNMWEFTTEFGYRDAGKDSQQYVVGRGGCFMDYCNGYPVSGRDGWGSSGNCQYGFRVVLYVK